MIALRVSRNGEDVCLAGVGDVGVLTAIVGWVKRPEGQLDPDDPGEDRLNLNIGALDSRTDENQQWPSQDLVVGDSVTIQIVEAEMEDPPSERYVHPEEQRIANIKDNARRLAAELGWTLIEEPSLPS